ncbi:MAG: hypothetical protein KA436_01865 [Oligoflexales bacterium]|nr:hypothetical protein [Oligoflexales bacterium]
MTFHNRFLFSVSLLSLLSGCGNVQTQDSSQSRNTKLSLQDTNPGDTRYDEFLALVKDSSELQKNNDREFDRRGKLKLELLSASSAGCMADIAVNAVEIIITGERMADLNVSPLYQGSSNLPKTSELASVYTITFNDAKNEKSVSYTNDESKNPLFGASRHFSPVIDPTKPTIKIGEIDQIKIQKGSASFKKIDPCSKAGVQAKAVSQDCALTQIINETGRYLLKGLQIKVNGNVLYTNNELNHSFSVNRSNEPVNSSGIEWVDREARLNADFTALLQREGCTK